MSLDIYIKSSEKEEHICECPTCYNEHKCESYPEIAHFNITHNLGKMADACGVYDCVWRPDEHSINTCKQMIEPLRLGILRLQEDPEKYKAFNPSNGWGSYEGLIKVLSEYLLICIENPDAKIVAWR